MVIRKGGGVVDVLFSVEGDDDVVGVTESQKVGCRSKERFV